jgi:hypothetical protein
MTRVLSNLTNLAEVALCGQSKVAQGLSGISPRPLFGRFMIVFHRIEKYPSVGAHTVYTNIQG